MKILKKKLMAKVIYSQGLTLSKNYQSWRVDAGVQLDCEIADIKDTFDKAKKLVEEQLSIAVDENKKVLGDVAKVVAERD
jgi:hypothetical protein